MLPPFNARKHLPSRLARLRELDGATSVLVRGQGTEFDSLRDYVRGDDVRSIDWRATARRYDPVSPTGTRLVVRTWRPERDRRVVIVIDSGRTSAARIANEPRLDTAFESALLLAALASSAGDRVDLVIFDRRVRGRVQGATGAELLSRMVSAMAPVDPELIEPDWAAVPGLVRSVTAQRALVVIATTIDAPGGASGLLSVLPQLTRKHTVVVSSVTDPDVLGATEERGGPRGGLPRGGGRARAARPGARRGGHPAARRGGRHRLPRGSAARPRRPLHRAQGGGPAVAYGLAAANRTPALRRASIVATKVTNSVIDADRQDAVHASLAKRVVAELFGTFVLVIGVIGTALFSSPNTGWLGVALAVGIAVIGAAYAVGHISGGHFNPAVTLGAAASGRFAWRDVPAYVLAQILGGLLATTVLFLRRARQAELPRGGAGGGFASNGFDAHSPGGFGLVSVIIVEVVLTAVFLYVILGVTDRRAPTGFAPLAIGLTLTLIHLIAIPVSNASVNPARSIATAVYGGPDALVQLWVFLRHAGRRRPDRRLHLQVPVRPQDHLGTQWPGSA